MLWITGLTALWITGLTALWITLAGLAVDYDAAHLWISELGQMWGLASPPHPSGRTESCTLRILRMLLLVLTGCLLPSVGWGISRAFAEAHLRGLGCPRRL